MDQQTAMRTAHGSSVAVLDRLLRHEVGNESQKVVLVTAHTTAPRSRQRPCGSRTTRQIRGWHSTSWPTSSKLTF